jgi:hypothetical protein
VVLIRVYAERRECRSLDDVKLPVLPSSAPALLSDAVPKTSDLTIRGSAARLSVASLAGSLGSF